MSKQLELLDIKTEIIGDTKRIRKATIEIFSLAEQKAYDQDRYKREVARALFLREIDKKPATNSKDIVLNMNISEKVLKEIEIAAKIEKEDNKSTVARKKLLSESKTIGDLRLIRDLSESKYQAALKSLDGLKSNLSALQSILRHQDEI